MQQAFNVQGLCTQQVYSVHRDYPYRKHYLHRSLAQGHSVLTRAIHTHLRFCKFTEIVHTVHSVKLVLASVLNPRPLFLHVWRRWTQDF